jgi:hypothetical protein
MQQAPQSASQFAKPSQITPVRASVTVAKIRLNQLAEDQPEAVLGVLDYWLGMCDDVYPPRTAAAQN